MDESVLPLNKVYLKYKEHLVFHDLRKFPVFKARALECVMIAVMLAVAGGAIYVQEWLTLKGGGNFQTLVKLFPFVIGPLIFVKYWLEQKVQRYRISYRTTMALADRRRPILYLRAFRSDDIVEVSNDFNEPGSLTSIPGALYKWFTGSPDPTLAYSLEEEVASYFQELGHVVSIGRPNDARPPVGSTRLYVEDNYWQAVVSDLIEIAQIVIVRADVTTGLLWEINKVLSDTSQACIVFLLANAKGQPMHAEDYAYFRQFISENCGELLPVCSQNLWYVFRNPSGSILLITADKASETLPVGTYKLLSCIKQDEEFCKLRISGLVEYTGNHGPIARMAELVFKLCFVIIAIDALRILLFK